MSGRYNEPTAATRSSNPPSTDGALDRMLRIGQKQQHVPAIFIHAGAGFHSHQNEHVHLQACVAAADMGMRFLRAGASATEAVEASLRVLEDKEITNAGYGSNLSIEGAVECDATIVDHLGRSGACGAVPNIRNPISLAKLILDTSMEPLSLRRVPPNALVGEGARLFAVNHGMVTFSNDHLVSKNARDRFLRWQDDLRSAESRTRAAKVAVQTTPVGSGHGAPRQGTVTPGEGDRATHRDHTAAFLTGTWNEGQPDSPYAGTPGSESSTAAETPSATGYFRGPAATVGAGGRPSAWTAPERLAVPSAVSRSRSPGHRSRRRGEREASVRANNAGSTAVEDGVSRFRDGSMSPNWAGSHEYDSFHSSTNSHSTIELDRSLKRSIDSTEAAEQRPEATTFRRPPRSDLASDDFISDTIGAIAIDEHGLIAAGSSSGGIGMKHRGRLGPAALVGIGTAVVPCADDDEEGVCVAAVTSGTGEHMATTMASQRCAERVYRGTRRGPKGIDVQDEDEDAILESFIADDFMAHPGVKNCHSAGAIGVMVVKKCRTGYYFYFAHNTDSFALASMGALEKEPACAMSRLSEGAKIARGGRKIRID